MNKVFLIGNLTKDPELTTTNNGTSVCRFSIAVNRNYKSTDGETITDYFNCVAWKGLAETISKYSHKGDKVAVTGSIEIKNYEDSKSNKRTSVDVNVGEIEFLNQRQNSNSSTLSSGNKPASKKPNLQSFDEDSDIPF